MAIKKYFAVVQTHSVGIRLNAPIVHYFNMHSKHANNCIELNGKVFGYGDKSAAQRRLEGMKEKHPHCDFKLTLMAFEE